MEFGVGFDLASVSFFGLSTPSETLDIAMRGDCQQSCRARCAASGLLVLEPSIDGWLRSWLTSGRLLCLLCKLFVYNCFFLVACSPGILSWLSEPTSLMAWSF